MVMAAGAAAQTVWDGSADTTWYTGPSAQAFNITTAEQLAGLAQLVNNGNTFAGKTITLGANIFLNDTAGSTSAGFNPYGKIAWTPIGTSGRSFQGEFDGIAGANNRKVYGLYIPEGGQYQGLFGRITATVRNLDVLVGQVTGTDYVGGVAGYGSSFTNVNSNVAVTGKNYVGGIVGRAERAINRVTARGNITADGRYVGGLAGYTDYPIESSNYSNGEISGIANYVGGLAGYTTSEIIASYTDGNVTGQDTVGGLAGYIYSSGSSGESYDRIKNSYSLKSVKARNFVGGLVGYFNSYTSYSPYGRITNCYSAGDVKGNFQVGGLAGYTSGGTIDSCYSRSNVIGDDNVGGLVGSLYAYNNNYGGIIQNSYMRGNVAGDNGNSSAGNDNLGGLVGYAFSRSRIAMSYALGTVTGTTKVGGLVGRADGITITNAYSQADVTAMAYGDAGSVYAGGLVGFTNGTCNFSGAYSSGAVSAAAVSGGLVGNSDDGMLTLNGCYYDITTSGQTRGVGSNASAAGVSGKTTAEMKRKETFSGWSWETWGIDDGGNYPYLSWNAVRVSFNPEDDNMIISEDFEESAHSFTLVNGSLTNPWVVGTANAISGLKSAYVSYSSNGGTVHMYSDVVFPVSSEPYTLRFNWRGDGLSVYLVDTSITPTAGTSLGSSTQLWYSGQSSTYQAAVNIPASNAGTTKRLVFSCNNPYYSYAAVDDIVLQLADSQVSIGIPPGSSISAAQKPPPSDFTRAGYINDGKWYIRTGTSPDYTYTEFVFGDNGTPVNSNITLYLNWQVFDGVLTFDRVVPPTSGTEAAVVSPAAPPAGEFTAGPNPVSKTFDGIAFFWQGKALSGGSLSVFDASGNLVRKLVVRDNAVTGSVVRRAVGLWDLRDGKGRHVPEGAYLARGKVVTSGGAVERVSVVVGVR
jgi:hypothetical protein